MMWLSRSTEVLEVAESGNPDKEHASMSTSFQFRLLRIKLGARNASKILHRETSKGAWA